MAQMNVSVPNLMKEWCEAQVTQGRYSTTSDYVRDLIRRDQERRFNVKALQSMIDDGLASAISSRSLDDILEEARTRAEHPTPHEG